MKNKTSDKKDCNYIGKVEGKVFPTSRKRKNKKN